MVSQNQTCYLQGIRYPLNFKFIPFSPCFTLCFSPFDGLRDPADWWLVRLTWLWDVNPLIVRVEKWDCKAMSGDRGNSSLSSDGTDWETCCRSPAFLRPVSARQWWIWGVFLWEMFWVDTSGWRSRGRWETGLVPSHVPKGSIGNLGSAPGCLVSHQGHQEQNLEQSSLLSWLNEGGLIPLTVLQVEEASFYTNLQNSATSLDSTSQPKAALGKQSNPTASQQHSQVWVLLFAFFIFH